MEHNNFVVGGSWFKVFIFKIYHGSIEWVHGWRFSCVSESECTYFCSCQVSKLYSTSRMDVRDVIVRLYIRASVSFFFIWISFLMLKAVVNSQVY